MDPLAIVGLVGNVVQFVSFGHELVTSIRELSGTGGLREVRQLKLLIQDVQDSNNRISGFFDNEDGNQLSRGMGHLRRKIWGDPDQVARELRPLRGIADECRVIATDLLKHLDGFEMKTRGGFSRKLEAVKISGELWWKRKEIDDLKARLLELETRLARWWTTTMLKHQEDQVYAILASINSLGSKFAKLEEETPNPQMHGLDQLKKELDHRFQSIEQQAHRHNTELHNSMRELMSSKDLTAGNSANATTWQGHTADLRTVAQCVQNYMDEWRNIIRAQEILETLTFETIHKRHDNIEHAHEDTCIWVFDTKRTNFVEWLKFGSSVYWMNGFAGSGKSTLLKFVSDHIYTRAALREWAGSRKLVTASHYFWNAGTDMQKSQQGLLQTLLYHVLEAEPSLYTVLCPSHLARTPWDLEELMAAFKALSTAPNIASSFCFFIDGLDEYQGPEEDIIRVINFLAASPNIKICASSRPWPAFFAEWNSSWYTFKMQDFTRADMLTYVREYLQGSSKFRSAAARDPSCQNLIPNIVQRASGVWLWVYLVVRDILRDIRDGEPFQQWQNRLESYPQELREYFRKILERIDPFYRKQGLPVLYESGPTAFAADKDWQIVTDDDMDQMYRVWQPRLQNRCRDLLKIISIGKGVETSVSYEVVFLHRTVRDFLDEHYTEDLAAQTSGGRFHEAAYMGRVLLVLVKQCQLVKISIMDSSLRGMADEFLAYMRDAQGFFEENKLLSWQFTLMEAFQQAMTTITAQEIEDSGYSSWIKVLYDRNMSFLQVAIQARIRHYSLHSIDITVVHPGQSSLYMRCALEPDIVPLGFPCDTSQIDLQLVAGLVARGIDPNVKVRRSSAWERFLHLCELNWTAWSHSKRQEALVAIRVFICHGAKTDVLISGQSLDDLFTQMFDSNITKELKAMAINRKTGYGARMGRFLTSSLKSSKRS